MSTIDVTYMPHAHVHGEHAKLHCELKLLLLRYVRVCMCVQYMCVCVTECMHTYTSSVHVAVCTHVHTHANVKEICCCMQLEQFLWCTEIQWIYYIQRSFKCARC